MLEKMSKEKIQQREKIMMKRKMSVPMDLLCMRHMKMVEYVLRVLCAGKSAEGRKAEFDEKMKEEK